MPIRFQSQETATLDSVQLRLNTVILRYSLDTMLGVCMLLPSLPIVVTPKRESSN